MSTDIHDLFAMAGTNPPSVTLDADLVMARGRSVRMRRRVVSSSAGLLGVAAVVASVVALVGPHGGGTDRAVASGSAVAPSSGAPVSSPDVAATSPVGVIDRTLGLYGVPLNVQRPGVPTVELWLDFQCPSCAQFVQSRLPVMETWANDGGFNLVARPTTFLDRSLPQSQLSSTRATNAWGCAVDLGYGREYLSALFARQPSVEGVGYTDAQLVEVGLEAGRTKDSAGEVFTSCVADHRFFGWAANSDKVFRDSGIPGTPTLVVDGVEVPNSIVAGPADELRAYLVAGGKGIGTSR